jgi:hypothetical protein
MIIDNYEDSRRYTAPPEYGYPDAPDEMDIAKMFAEQEEIDNEAQEEAE